MSPLHVPDLYKGTLRRGFVNGEASSTMSPNPRSMRHVLPGGEEHAIAKCFSGPDAASFTLIKNPLSLVLQALSTVIVPGGNSKGSGLFVLVCGWRRMWFSRFGEESRCHDHHELMKLADCTTF